MAKIERLLMMLVVSASIALAIGPAPITVSGIIEGSRIDMIRVHAVDTSGRIIVTEDPSIAVIDGRHQGYISTLTVDDDENLWTIQLEYIQEGRMVASEIFYNVSPWQDISMNVSFSGDSPETELRSSVRRPNTVENELSIRQAEQEIIEGNISFVKERFPEHDILKPGTEEQPVEVQSGTADSSYLVILALICLVVALAFAKLYLRKRKV